MIEDEEKEVNEELKRIAAQVKQITSSMNTYINSRKIGFSLIKSKQEKSLRSEIHSDLDVLDRGFRFVKKSVLKYIETRKRHSWDVKVINSVRSRGQQ